MSVFCSHTIWQWRWRSHRADRTGSAITRYVWWWKHAGS